MIYKVKIKQNIETVKQELEEKAKAHGFCVLNVYDFTQIMEDKGFPVNKHITVFTLCNPRGAQQALSQIAELSVYLPFRLSIYEEDDVTVLAIIGIEEIVNAVDVDERFKSFMLLIYENLKRVMHSWDI